MTELLIDDHGAVRVLTMNRPDKRNALNLSLSEALFVTLLEADKAKGVRAIVLRTRPWSSVAPTLRPNCTACSRS